MKYQDRITVDAQIRSGKPSIRGTRITVYDVLEYLAGGNSEAELLADFPDLTHEDVLAVLAFAAARERRLVASAA
jgi:uncharacterized protein (DUF433 family)